MLYFHSLLLLAAVVRSFPTAVPIDTSSEEEMIPVPGSGWRSKSSVHVIPHGGQVATVGDEFHLLDASGKVLHVAPTPGALKSPSHNISARTALITEGWVTTAVWDGSPTQVISSSKATWTVPSAPETRWHFQTLYYFNAIGCDGLIFQPVLRFTFEGWTVASWMVGPTGTFVTESVPVAVGQVLTGVMTQTKQSATSYALVSSFTGIPNATLSLTYTSPMYIGWASAFEQYGTRTHSFDYPPDTSMTFSNIDLKFFGTAPTVSYRVRELQPTLGTTTITTNGGTAAKTVMHFPPPPFKLMTYCTFYNFTGGCDTVTYPSAASVPLATDPIQCLNIDGTDTFQKSISAANVTYTYECFLYQNANCGGSRFRVDDSYPDLRLVAFDDVAMSWSCNKRIYTPPHTNTAIPVTSSLRSAVHMTLPTPR
ncbi:hypothetical protein C8J57DRAFT_1705144 [Mycena rebaudengoi]|nr:hypothetical protein C8J57DRAFT_1705144 [Mycena rebaudengoi]